MTRRTGPAALLLALLVALLAPAPASAQQTLVSSQEVVAELQRDGVYVDPDAEVDVSESRLRAEIGRMSPPPMYVAVLPAAVEQRAGGRLQVNQSIGRQLGANAVLFTVTGRTVTGGAGGGSGLGQGEADRIAPDTVGTDATEALVRAVSLADAAAADGPAAGNQQSGGFSSSQDRSAGGGGGALAVLGLLAAAAGGLFYLRTRKRRVQDLEGDRADVESLYNRLGADVSNLHPGDDPVARQALADAAERYTATGALLSQADTPGEFAAARRTVVEGLTAARLARTRLGVDPGPEVPPPPGQAQGAQLQQAERVRVGDAEIEGSPQYQPGRQHYYGGGYVGGRYVPGGWYGVPFWETAMIGGMIGGMTGGLTGGLIGGGLAAGGGYERGYEEGVEDAQEVFGDGSGGGDWGGDWGGSGGSGDWGGGDWGGGGSGDWGGGGSGNGGGW